MKKFTLLMTATIGLLGACGNLNEVAMTGSSHSEDPNSLPPAIQVTEPSAGLAEQGIYFDPGTRVIGNQAPVENHYFFFSKFSDDLWLGLPPELRTGSRFIWACVNGELKKSNFVSESPEPKDPELKSFGQGFYAYEGRGGNPSCTPSVEQQS